MIYLDGPLIYTNEPVGFRVEKLSGKRFSSGNYVNTVIGETVNPNTGKVAYRFLEDNSIVDQRSCKEAEENREISLLMRQERREQLKEKKREWRRNKKKKRKQERRQKLTLAY